MSSEAIERLRGRRTSDSDDKSVSQSQIIRKNISAISEVQLEEDKARTLSQRISDRITSFSGSMLFLWLHVGWFGLWILLNIGILRLPRISEFDPFPFGLLTMIVSLEAIFLSTFVLISQNRMAKLAEQRSELDLHVNLLAEQKSAKTLEMLDQMAKQLSRLNRFDIPHDPEVEALKGSPEPQDVLKVMKDALEDETGEIEEKVGKAVEEITGEMEVVREDVEELKEDVREDTGEVKKEVKAIKRDVEEIKMRTGEHDGGSLN
jgi:uncharacterized membrane protein